MCKLFMKDNNCLLLTGTIDSGIFHNVGNRITNTSVRLEQYVNSIKKYIEDSAYDDLDAVFPAFAFEVYDEKNRLAINWNKSHWGHICFSNMVLRGSRDDT